MTRRYWGVTDLGKALQAGEITKTTTLEDVQGNQYTGPSEFIAALIKDPLRADTPFPVVPREEQK